VKNNKVDQILNITCEIKSCVMKINLCIVRALHAEDETCFFEIPQLSNKIESLTNKIELLELINE
jgi:hypothetical protein